MIVMMFNNCWGTDLFNLVYLDIYNESPTPTEPFGVVGISAGLLGFIISVGIRY
jgi:hypothetical protein